VGKHTLQPKGGLWANTHCRPVRHAWHICAACTYGPAQPQYARDGPQHICAACTYDPAQPQCARDGHSTSAQHAHNGLAEPQYARDGSQHICSARMTKVVLMINAFTSRCRLHKQAGHTAPLQSTTPTCLVKLRLKFCCICVGLQQLRVKQLLQLHCIHLALEDTFVKRLMLRRGAYSLRSALQRHVAKISASGDNTQAKVKAGKLSMCLLTHEL